MPLSVAGSVDGETVYVSTREGMELPIKMTEIDPEELFKLARLEEGDWAAAASYLLSRLRLTSA